MVGLTKRRLLSKSWTRRRSNSRVAWLVASGAVAAMLALPQPADAQTGPDFNARAANGGSPSMPLAGGARTATPAARPKADLIDISDRLDQGGRTATIIVTPSHASAADVVCLAGCDGPAGKVVFHGGSNATPVALATIDANQQALTAAIKSAATTTAEPSVGSANSGVITCLAGCYGETRRAAAVNSSPAVAAVPQPSQNPSQVAQRSAPKRATPSSPVMMTEATPQVAAVVKPKAVKLRTAYTPHQRGKKTQRRYATKPRATVVTIRKPTPVMTIASATPARPVEPAQAPVVPPAPVTTPLTTIEEKPAAVVAKPAAIVVKPAPKKAERTPVAAVSNDWFNRINRERKAAKASTTE